MHPLRRYGIALSSAMIHFSIGSVYAYSVLLTPLENSLGWTPKDVKWAFSLAIVFLGLSSAFLGPKIQKWGPRASARLCGLAWPAGLALAALAVHRGDLWLFYLGYGVLGGIGLGIGYLAPISSLVRWFPDKKGLGTGICVMGFGLSALVFGPLMSHLFGELAGGDGAPLAAHQGAIAKTLLLVAGLDLVLIQLFASFLADPPEPAAKATSAAAANEDLTLREAAGSLNYALIWGMFFLNIVCGISLISVAAKMAGEWLALTGTAAATVVGLLGLFNGLGRFGWAAASDRLGCLRTFQALYVVQLLVLGALLLVPNPSTLLFELLLCIWITCYGGGFAVLPSFLGERFGRTHLASIQGATLTAWSAAGLFGPFLITALHDSAGTYRAALPVFAGALALALGLSVVLGLRVRASAKA